MTVGNDTIALFLRDRRRMLRALGWIKRLRLGFYLEPIDRDLYLLHVATRAGADRAHRYGGRPLYTFP